MSKAFLFLCAVAAVVAAPSVARAQPRPAWDSHGWVMLGEREVHGHGRENDDRIEVGRYEGRFTKLTIVVLDADLEMIDFNVRFGGGEPFHPAVSQIFREGTRTRVIDLPGYDGRTIRYLDFRYRNVPGEGHARIQVWAKEEAVAPPPPPPPPAWNSAGWTMLGEREVHGHGRENDDRIEVGRYEGRFTKLTIVVLDADLEMIDFAVKFGGGEPFHPAVSQIFREGTRTRMIDLPGYDGRTIRYLDFRYRNVPGEGHARIQVWAKAEAVAPPPPPPPAPAVVWNSDGWTMLGEREVHGHGRENADRIDVGRYEGHFSRLTVVVLDSDLEMIDFSIQLARGEPFHPVVNQFFREGTRTHGIDLPGGERIIRFIDFRYRNLPGEGHARIQVWAK